MEKENEMPKITASKTDEIFQLVKTKNGVRITIGNYLVTNKIFKEEDDAENYLKKKPYELLINLMFIAFKTIMKNENNTENKKNE